jgi:hypothetical protein
MQVKTTLRFHLIPVGMAIFKNTNFGKDIGEGMRRNPHTLLVGM